ncbi:MAG: cation:dicarboxylase symporter family transporter [Sphingobium sp.]|uniref:dicarboxylate/amino acid:cation symporter n=1 Tax=Sphingobium sp. TaxID=1912891 RepID=UPI0029BF3EF1|nr:cation:dicarboxylase symporter family transporter [Sphingobium sp.]MDX3910495.1 cation:dicarboxylase symporter family transporter [Sphingobium sp.]
MFAALVVGLGAGMVMSIMHLPGQRQVLAVAQPIGQLWLDALTMTVVPLVFGLLVTGIASAATTASSSNVAVRSVLWFAVLLTAACILSALSTNTLLALWPVSDKASLATSGTSMPELAPAAEWFRGIIPTNPIKAAAETAMVPLVLFAVLFGLATARIEPALGATIVTFFQAVVQAMLVIVGWVLWIAPVGILALAYAAAARMGVSAAGTLLQYIVTVIAACLITTIMAYAAAVMAGRMSLARFARAAAPAQTVAISTQSSLASLPVMIDAAAGLGIGKASAGVVLPLAVSIFRAASAAANVAVAIYLAHLHGVSLSLPVLAIGTLIAVPVSLAAVGLPAQVSFFATIGPVCLAMGVPIEALPLLLAVETVPDLFRTLGNVTADLAVARLASDRIG